VARERGQRRASARYYENQHASALTAPSLAGVDVVIDFTAPEAAVRTCAPCWRWAHTRGRHTGWYGAFE